MPTPSTPEGDADRWREILAAGEAILGWTSGFDESQYLADERTCAAVAMYIVIIAEAAGRMSEETKRRLSVPWPQIAALRNRIAHGYSSIDHKRVWLVVSAELPLLLNAARRELA